MSLYDVERNLVGRAQPRNDVPAGGFDDTQDFSAWIEQELQRNPGYQMPQGYSVSPEGRVTRDKEWLSQHPWIFPVAGIGAGLAGGALAGTGLLGGGGGAGAAAGGEAAIPTTMGMGGAGGGLPSWLGPALAAGVGVAGRAVGGGTGGNQIPMPPELQQLLTEATRRSMNQGPLSDAVTQQALASLPSYARK